MKKFFAIATTRDCTRLSGKRLTVKCDWSLDVLPGHGLALIAKIALPNAEQTRQKLLRLRRERGFSRGQMAALLGVSVSTLRRWEEGTRGPCAAARRLVQLVERLYFRPGDFPPEPLQNVFAALQADMADKLASLRQRREAA